MYRLIVDKMEQYLDAKVKRYVQKQLFANKQPKNFLGLAGMHPEEYMKVIPKNSGVLLVDINPPKNSEVGVFEADICTGYEAMTEYIEAPDMVDCDFCKTVITCGSDFVYLYNRMRNNGGKFIAFTFSVRNAGVLYTLNYLKNRIPEFTYIDEWESLDLPFVGHRQFIKKMKNHPVYMYRDSGAIMLSGIITLQAA